MAEFQNEPRRGDPLEFDAKSHGEQKYETPRWLTGGFWISATLMGLVFLWVRTLHH